MKAQISNTGPKDFEEGRVVLSVEIPCDSHLEACDLYEKIVRLKVNAAISPPPGSAKTGFRLDYFDGLPE